MAATGVQARRLGGVPRAARVSDLQPVSRYLGANPVETVTNTTGIWTLRFIVATLAITPLRWLTGINQLINYRRLIGLFAFFYGSLHFTTYFFLDHQFDFAGMWEDVRQAAVHHRRLHRVRPDDSAGAHLDDRVDPAAGRQELEPAAQADLHHRLAAVLHYFWKVSSRCRRPTR